MKKKRESTLDYFKRRKKANATGKRFELKVRNNLEKEGWIVDKWSNNVNLKEEKLIKVKNLFLGPGKPLMLGAGFPDFIAFRTKRKNHEIIGVEARTIGRLSKEEREKCKWYLNNKIFSKILIAKLEKEGRRINVHYIDFKEKYKK